MIFEFSLTNIVTFLVILVSTYCFMEFMANFSHRYVMHGFMWYWHEDHHSKKPLSLRAQRSNLIAFIEKHFEKNDIFFVIYATPCMALLISNLWYPNLFTAAIGFGIMAYGWSYFIVHDLIIHQRIKNRFLMKNKYVQALIKAHRVHHARHEKEGCENFGMLYVPKKYHQ